MLFQKVAPTRRVKSMCWNFKFNDRNKSQLSTRVVRATFWKSTNLNQDLLLISGVAILSLQTEKHSLRPGRGSPKVLSHRKSLKFARKIGRKALTENCVFLFTTTKSSVRLAALAGSLGIENHVLPSDLGCPTFNSASLTMAARTSVLMLLLLFGLFKGKLDLIICHSLSHTHLLLFLQARRPLSRSGPTQPSLVAWAMRGSWRGWDASLRQNTSEPGPRSPQ